MSRLSGANGSVSGGTLSNRILAAMPCPPRYSSVSLASVSTFWIRPVDRSTSRLNPVSAYFIYGPLARLSEHRQAERYFPRVIAGLAGETRLERLALHAAFAPVRDADGRLAIRAGPRRDDRHFDLADTLAVAGAEFPLDNERAAFERGDPVVFEIAQEIVEEGDGLGRLPARKRSPGFGAHRPRRRDGIRQFAAERLHQRVDEAAPAQRRLGEEGAHAQCPELVEPVRVLHDARRLAALQPVVVQAAQRLHHRVDVGVAGAVLGQHGFGDPCGVLFFRHIVIVVLPLMEFAGVVVQGNQHGKQRIGSFGQRELVGDGRGVLRMLEQELRGRLPGLPVVALLRVHERAFDARMKPGKAGLQEFSHLVHRRFLWGFAYPTLESDFAGAYPSATLNIGGKTKSFDRDQLTRNR